MSTEAPKIGDKVVVHITSPNRWYGTVCVMYGLGGTR